MIFTGSNKNFDNINNNYISCVVSTTKFSLNYVSFVCAF